MSKWILVVPQISGEQGEVLDFTPLSVHNSLQEAMDAIRVHQSIYCNSLAYLYECDKPPLVCNYVDGKYFIQ